MNQKELKELIEFLIEKDIAEFELERGDVKVKIRRGGEPVVSTAPDARFFAVHSAPPPRPEDDRRRRNPASDRPPQPQRFKASKDAWKQAASTPQGKELRLKQEFFLTSAALQDILRRYRRRSNLRTVL